MSNELKTPPETKFAKASSVGSTTSEEIPLPPTLLRSSSSLSKKSDGSSSSLQWSMDKKLKAKKKISSPKSSPSITGLSKGAPTPKGKAAPTPKGKAAKRKAAPTPKRKAAPTNYPSKSKKQKGEVSLSKQKTPKIVKKSPPPRRSPRAHENSNKQSDHHQITPVRQNKPKASATDTAATARTNTATVATTPIATPSDGQSIFTDYKGMYLFHVVKHKEKGFRGRSCAAKAKLKDKKEINKCCVNRPIRAGDVVVGIWTEHQYQHFRHLQCWPTPNRLFHFRSNEKEFTRGKSAEEKQQLLNENTLQEMLEHCLSQKDEAWEVGGLLEMLPAHQMRVARHINDALQKARVSTYSPRAMLSRRKAMADRQAYLQSEMQVRIEQQAQANAVTPIRTPTTTGPNGLDLVTVDVDILGKEAQIHLPNPNIPNASHKLTSLRFVLTGAWPELERPEILTCWGGKVQQDSLVTNASKYEADTAGKDQVKAMIKHFGADVKEAITKNPQAKVRGEYLLLGKYSSRTLKRNKIPVKLKDALKCDRIKLIQFVDLIHLINNDGRTDSITCLDKKSVETNWKDPKLWTKPDVASSASGLQLLAAAALPPDQNAITPMVTPVGARETDQVVTIHVSNNNKNETERNANAFVTALTEFKKTKSKTNEQHKEIHRLWKLQQFPLAISVSDRLSMFKDPKDSIADANLMCLDCSYPWKEQPVVTIYGDAFLEQLQHVNKTEWLIKSMIRSHLQLLFHDQGHPKEIHLLYSPEIRAEQNKFLKKSYDVRAMDGVTTILQMILDESDLHHYVAVKYDLINHSIRIFDGKKYPGESWAEDLMFGLKMMKLIDEKAEAEHVLRFLKGTKPAASRESSRKKRKWEVIVDDSLKQKDNHTCGPCLIFHAKQIIRNTNEEPPTSTEQLRHQVLDDIKEMNAKHHSSLFCFPK